jgi:hypothetical protein
MSIEQILPFRVAAFDQVELPRTPPALDALFMRDGVADGGHVFGPHQPIQPIALTEIRPGAGSVLMDAGSKVGGHTNTECTAVAAGHHIHPTTALLHWAEWKRSWTPGQARGDDRR